MIYRFGACELDESKGELRREGRPVPLQPKPLALLTLLLEERQRIVSNDELFERLWPGETVTPSSLSRAVSVARSAIGDRGRAGWIRSYTRRGYRFHGDVIELEEAGPAASPSGAAPAAAPGAGGPPFVGREDALVRLRAAWDRAARGRGGIALIVGPPGIGKSRLAEVFAAEVARRGGLALRGRALEEEGEPAFWVWAQVLRGLHAELPDVLREPGLAGSGELAALMPELAAADTDAASRLPSEQRRFVFFDAVARALRSASRQRPLLVVFEDAHWADPASLRLLEHLAFELAGAPVLLLVTVRDGTADCNDATRHSLAVLTRQDRCETLALERLGLEAVGQAVSALLGRADPPLAERLLAQTDGVPLFLREALRRLADPSAAADLRAGELPLGRADWVSEALARLSAPCAALIGAAAVVGREFPLPLVATACDVSRDVALDRLDEAGEAGVIEPSPQDPARYRFVHALFREAAYAALRPAARVRLHRQVARALEQRHAGEEDRVIAELAHHHHHALAVGDPERAFACAARAAERAFDVSAYEQALRHGLQALAAIDHAECPDPLRRLETLLRLGEAARLSGERRERRRWFCEALELARAQDRPEALAAAAIGLCDLAEWGVRDDLARTALEEALARLERPSPELEARILTRLGYLDSLFDREQAETLLRRAVRQARELGAAEPLEEALYALHFLLGGPEGHAERLEILEELRGAASSARDPVASVIAVLDVACDRIERGDIEGAARLRREADRTAGTRPHPRTIWHRRVFDTGLALMEGRLEEVEARAEDAASLGRRIQHPYAEGCRLSHIAHLERERGEAGRYLERMEPGLRASQGPTHWLALGVARARLATGRSTEGEELYRRIAAAGIDAIPRNLRWIATLVELAHACADFEDADTAAALVAALSRFERHHGVMPMVITYAGPASWALARLQVLRGYADEAEALFSDALAQAIALGAQPTQARIRVDQGRLLRRRGRRSEARQTLAAAAALAADLGLPDLERIAASELAR